MTPRRPGHVVVLTALLAACRGPTVNLATREPLAVDLTLRVDIYQHAPGAPAPENGDPGAVEERRRARMAEIQSLKNSRLVGENHLGLLSIRELPPGEYGRYVTRTVEEENADRTRLMRALAEGRREPLARIEEEQAHLWRERTFPGEWMEEKDADGTWRWVQKGAAAAAPPA
jgi:hypothetical protein